MKHRITHPRDPAHRRVLGEFTSADTMLAGIDALRSAGYEDLETFTPFDVPGLSEHLGLRRSKIGWIVVAGGLIGLILGYGIQWFANVYNYPLNSGGRPVHAIPAFVFPTFEATVLFAGFAAFFGVFALLRLPRLWAPIDEINGFGRASIDRFWVAVGAISTDTDGDQASEILRKAGALNTVGPTNV